MTESNPNPFFNQPLLDVEEGLKQVMDTTLALTSMMRPDAPEYLLRSKIVATNLRALSNVLLVADAPDSAVNVNIKQLILSLLATADWLEPPDELINDAE